MTTDLFKSIYVAMRIYTTMTQSKSITWSHTSEVLNAIKWATYCSEVRERLEQSDKNNFESSVFLSPLCRFVRPTNMLVKRFITKTFVISANEFDNMFHRQMFQSILFRMLTPIYYM